MILNASITSYFAVEGASADGSVALGVDRMIGRGRIAVHAGELTSVQQQRRASLGVRATTVVRVSAAALRAAGVTPKDRDQLVILHPDAGSGITSSVRYAVVSVSTLTAPTSGMIGTYILELLRITGGPDA